MLDRPLILTGFMESGKGGLGCVLAERLGCRFVDLLEVLSQVLKRLHGAVDRLLFAGSNAANSVKLLMDGREQFYADADIRIDTDGKSVEDVAAEILRFVEELHA